MNNFCQIIKEICQEQGIKYTYLSNNWITKLEKNNITKYIAGYKFDLNNHALGQLLDDKFATSDLLIQSNIKSVKHHIVYSKENKNNYALRYNTNSYVEKLFNLYNQDVVMKMNNGSCGMNVYHITKKDELLTIYNKLSNLYSSFSLSPYIDAKVEYRVIILEGEVKLIYGKIKPIVTGDGIKTKKQLLEEFNYSYFKKIDIDNEIIAKNQTYTYDWKFNLSRGAKITEEIPDREKLSEIAKKVAEVINLRFGSVDILKSDDYYILEINSGVMMNNYIEQKEKGYDIAKSIYRDAVIKMFETS